MTSSNGPHGRASRLPASLAAQLLVPLLVAVGGIMTAFAVWALVQRERTLAEEARRETRAYATALGLALDAAFRDPARAGVAEIVERISLQPSVYGVVVYDATGRPLFGPGVAGGETGPAPTRSRPPQQVRRALDAGEPAAFERVQDEVAVYSVVRPIQGEDGSVVGAFEVLQPLAFIEREKGRTRARFVLNTLVLFAAVTGLLLWLVRRLVSEPLARFSRDVRALGSGRLDHRVGPGATVAELAEVARELNRMAAGLEGAQREIVRGAEERIGLEREVRRSEKMAMMGHIATGLAHEIGAPLHVIRGRADLLARRSVRPEPESRDLGIIVEQIDRITRIVQALLDVARRRELRLAPVDVVAVVDGVLELLATELRPAGIEARRGGVPAALVLGDRDRLQQVALNLLLNARKALDAADGERRIDVTVSGELGTDGGTVSIEVRDTGPGIRPEDRERVFDPFYTTRSDGEGTGLGLSVVRSIVDEHGGSVRVGEVEGPGARMIVRLPAYREVDGGR